MITRISIRDFVLIDRLDMEASAGFTALSGETGAGKSIILDAIGLCLGWPAERRYIRAGAQQASVAIELAPPAQHPVWAQLEHAGFAAARLESLTFRRIIKTDGPSRAMLNDQPISAAMLGEIGETLIEIHGQHAASALMRPLYHRQLLDLYAGNEKRLERVRKDWEALNEARLQLCAIEEEMLKSTEDLEWLMHAAEELEALAPEAEEAEKLAGIRTRLMQSERVSDAIAEGLGALRKNKVEDALARAARCAERICQLPGFEAGEAGLPKAARIAADALERALVEAQEAAACLQALEDYAVHDGAALEAAETRLFALRALARKHNVQADQLPDILRDLQSRISHVTNGEGRLVAAREAAKAAQKSWDRSAAALSKARMAAAKRLQISIEAELVPLKLGQVKIRASLTPLSEGQSGAGGADHVEFEVQTTPGAGFGPLRQIASGGEMARFSLALKCALAEAGHVRTLIFDEADQGVGGAVAAAIGERLTDLAGKRQVFAVTHSPQVAAAADAQWLVTRGLAGKSRANTKSSTGGWTLKGLDEEARLEEIARMLSGRAITNEARAAAGRLLEDA